MRSAHCWLSPRAQTRALRSPRGPRAPSKKSILRAPGGEGKGVRACGSRGGTDELPMCQPARRVGRNTQHPSGAPLVCCTLKGWPAGRKRGSLAGCPLPAKPQDLPPAPRPRPAPSQPAPLLAQLAPCPVKIMVTTIASREELVEGPGGGEVEANPRGRHRQGGVLSPPSSPTQRTQRRPGTGSRK